jgi:LmbE family N-acetylglucosaminyl deacetylase
MSRPAAELIRLLSAPKPSPVKWLVVGAHPDDEVIGAGALIARSPRAWVVRLTDGSPHNPHDARAAGFRTRAAYARARRREIRAALRVAGMDSSRQIELGCADQDAGHRMAELTLRFAKVLERLGPDAIVTHPYEGGHPDHDAAAFVAHAACRLLGDLAPPVIEFTSYYARKGKFTVGRYLPGGDRGRPIRLTRREVALKQRMYDRFPSQKAVLDQFPIGIERFRVAPEYDFTRAPHRGKLNYEYFDWGMDPREWRREAKRALKKLGIRGLV